MDPNNPDNLLLLDDELEDTESNSWLINVDQDQDVAQVFGGAWGAGTGSPIIARPWVGNAASRPDLDSLVQAGISYGRPSFGNIGVTGAYEPLGHFIGDQSTFPDWLVNGDTEFETLTQAGVRTVAMQDVNPDKLGREIDKSSSKRSTTPPKNKRGHKKGTATGHSSRNLSNHDATAELHLQRLGPGLTKVKSPVAVRLPTSDVPVASPTRNELIPSTDQYRRSSIGCRYRPQSSHNTETIMTPASSTSSESGHRLYSRPSIPSTPPTSIPSLLEAPLSNHSANASDAQKTESARVSSGGSIQGFRYACPMDRGNDASFGRQRCNGEHGNGFKDMGRVRDHLYRAHISVSEVCDVPQCPEGGQAWRAVLKGKDKAESRKLKNECPHTSLDARDYIPKGKLDGIFAEAGSRKNEERWRYLHRRINDLQDGAPTPNPFIVTQARSTSSIAQMQPNTLAIDDIQNDALEQHDDQVQKKMRENLGAVLGDDSTRDMVMGLLEKSQKQTREERRAL